MSYIGNSPATSTEVADNSVTLAKMAGGTDGELITYDTSGDPTTVPTGSSGQVLTSNGAGTTPTFQTSTHTPDDNSVTLAKMAHGTDGELITYDATGTPANVAVGTSGQVLTSGGAGVAPTFQTAAGGGAWNLIGTAAASTSSSLDITGMDSTYDTYALVGSDLVVTNDGAIIGLRFGDSGGFDSGGSDYSGHRQSTYVYQSTYNAGGTSSASLIEFGASGNATGEGIGFMVFLHRPGDGATRPAITGTWNSFTTSTAQRAGLVFGSRNAVITLDRVQLLSTSSNIASGRFSVYGISHT